MTNPYSAPMVDSNPVSGTMGLNCDVTVVASQFRNLNRSVAVALICFVGMWLVPISTITALAAGIQLAGFLAFLFAIMLTFQLFTTGEAIGRLFLFFVPFLNFLLFIEVHSKAKGLLKAEGYKLGFTKVELTVPTADVAAF